MSIYTHKWNEVQITVDRILALTPHKPLYGHKTGKQAKTHWISFLKSNDRACFSDHSNLKSPCDKAAAFPPNIRS